MTRKILAVIATAAAATPAVVAFTPSAGSARHTSCVHLAAPHHIAVHPFCPRGAAFGPSLSLSCRSSLRKHPQISIIPNSQQQRRQRDSFFALHTSAAASAIGDDGHIDTEKVAADVEEISAEVDKLTSSVTTAVTDAYNEHKPQHEPIPLVEGFLKGLKSDWKKKGSFYKSDITDIANIKVLSTVGFLFFACLAPAVAFGGLMGVTTGGNIGSIEMLTATALCGMVYSVTSGQPLTIIGSTGPVLAFTTVLYRTTQSMGLPFLPVYSWVGLWTSGILAFCSFFSLSNLVEYFTRFTDEIFSLLISVIFIYEAVKDLSGLFINPAVPFVNACWSLIIASLTFGLARNLNKLRTTKFFNKRARDLLADFAPTIGVLTSVMTAIWGAGRYGVQLPTLAMPLTFSTTIGRPWRVPLTAIPLATRFACLIPAIMVSILLFMDQNITVRLVNTKKHMMKKKYGMHMDMLSIAGLTAACSVCGLPWLVAATVRSLAHVKALAVYETKDGKEEIVSMTEQRGSGFCIHACIGLAILCGRQYLSRVPLATLMGLFMYLGATGLKGNQLWDRVSLLFTDPNLRPKVPWVTNMAVKKTHIFTGIQLACLSGMWWIKSSSIGVLFPVLIAALAPIRVVIEKVGWFSEKEMEILDSED